MMTEEQLIERDSKRDIWAELLLSIRQMKAGQVGAVHKVKVSQTVAEELDALQTARFFAERKGKADFVQFRSILLRKGTLPPCEGDELNEKTGR